MTAAPPPPPPTTWQPPPGPPVAGGPQGPAGTPPRRPIWRSPKAWAIGIVVLVVLGAIGSMGRRDPGAASADADPTPTAAAVATAEPAITAAPTDAPTAAPVAASPAVTEAPAATDAPVATEAPAATPVPVPLVIVAPADGATLSDPLVTVAGIGPANARIVRDVSLGFDEDTTSDGTGSWSMVVELDEGPNRLVFRVGDDAATAVEVTVTYAPPAPTPEPEATPTPAPRFATIDDGTWVVGEEVKPGTYRLREPGDFCYWARLKGFGGSLSAIIANENVIGYGVVTIRATDKGFETSGCPTWTKDLSQVTTSKTRFGEGTFIVGTDLRPGTYRSTGGGDYCYWARLRDFRGQLSSIITNDLSEGRGIVTIRSSDAGFTSNGCGDWVRR